MKNIKTTFGIALFTIVLLISNGLQAQSQDKTNYIIILDLSDRILSPNQAKLDIAGINKVYDEFVRDVRSQLIIKSNAKFTIHILPQQNSKLNTDYYNELLSIDMSQYAMAKKRIAFDSFTNNLNNVLTKLYKEAKFSDSKSDYNGVDIWKYFNESLSCYLYDNYKNSVVVFTDGYFDFESNSYVKHSGNRYTSTKFLKYLKVANWKVLAEQKDFGLVKINHLFPSMKVIVVGINPKSQSLDEVEKIHYFWTKWTSEMGIEISIINRTTTLQLKQRLNLALL